MKLSDKGWHKVVVAQNLLDDPDLEQSDFEGAVVLTAEEAKNIEMCLHYCYDCTNGTHFRYMHSEVRFFLGLLRTKIKQMEKANETERTR